MARTRPARRIGVYVCHCGGNISDYVDVDQVIAAIEDEPGVVVARQTMFACSDASQQEMEHDIEEQQLDGLVVASLLAQAAHVHVPWRGHARRAEPVRVHARSTSASRLVGPHRRRRRHDRQGDRPGARRHRPHAADRAARADRRRDGAEDARHRRRHGRPARRHRPGRHRPAASSSSSASAQLGGWVARLRPHVSARPERRASWSPS